MTNEERIDQMCECLLYIIELLRAHDRLFDNHLEFVEKELEDIRKDIG